MNRKNNFKGPRSKQGYQKRNRGPKSKQGGQGRNSWFSFTFAKSKYDKMNVINRTLYTYDLDIMKDDGVHMTSVFMGKSLQGKQVTVLKAVNQFITEHMKKLKTLNLKFDKFDYFPQNAVPSKRRLLVALYEQDKHLLEWNLELRKKLIEFGLCDYDEPLLPHITIGYVKGEKLPEPSDVRAPYPDVTINGMYLCGQQNKHIDNVFSV